MEGTFPTPVVKGSSFLSSASVVSWSTEKTKYEIINFYWLKLRSFKYHQLADVLYIIFTREARLDESVSLEHVWQAQREGRGRKTPQTSLFPSTPTLPPQSFRCLSCTLRSKLLIIKAKREIGHEKSKQNLCLVKLSGSMMYVNIYPVYYLNLFTDHWVQLRYVWMVFTP